MKVFIITEGGENIGLGHITRCISIYQAFEEAIIKPQLIVNGDQTVGDLLSDKSCKVFNWLNDRKILLEAVQNADIVFVDSYLADYDLYEKLSSVVKTAVYIDDNLRLNYPKGFVLNGSIFAEQLRYPKREEVNYLLGTQYTPLRKEFWDIPDKPIRDNIESVLITFGGIDSHNVTPKVLKVLKDAYPELLKKVIISKSFQNIAEIERLKDSNTELIYYPNAAQMRKAMLDSDIAISAGGQTLYELARIGVPTIAVAVADNQSANIRSWQEVGFVEYAGEGANGELAEKISRKIERLKDSNTRQCKNKIGKKIVDGAGSLRIVKSVLSDFYRKRLILRKATLSDAEDLFNLANEDTVRRNSFSQSKIKWAEHTQWLNEKLGDGNCLFLIVDCSDKFAGQVLFNMIPLQSEAVINIGLSKSVRGLGLSAFVINKSIEELLKSHRDVRLIKAYIRESNTASVKAFEKAGFRFFENTMFKGCKAKVYERGVGNES